MSGGRGLGPAVGRDLYAVVRQPVHDDDREGIDAVVVGDFAVFNPEHPVGVAAFVLVHLKASLVAPWGCGAE